MKNKNDSYIKACSVLIFISFLCSCSNNSKNGNNQPNNNPDYKINFEMENESYYKARAGKYYVYKSVDKAYGNMVSTIDGEVKPINMVDSSDLPDKSKGEYDYYEIKFIDEKHVNLKHSSYSKEDDEGYNIKENWVTKCEIIQGSKTLFDNGANITLKDMNPEESDLSYSVFLKGAFIKKMNADPDNAISIMKTMDEQIVCNKKEIRLKQKFSYNSEFSLDPELKSYLINNK